MSTILHILQHALGRDEHGRSKTPGKDYRNHYAVDHPSADYDTCHQAAAAGLMREYGPSQLTGDCHIFKVTPAGVAYVEEHSPPAPKLTRSQRRYQAWLNGPADFQTFGEWLRSA